MPRDPRILVRRAAVVAALIFAIAASLHARGAAQTAPAASLTVSGDVDKPLTLSAADLKAMPRTKVEIKTDAITVVYEGVLVGEILARAGMPHGNDLRGSALATYVVATASDGYQVVFSLGEVDPALTKNDIIVADSAGGKPLDASQGPLRIVTPKDTRGARGVHMLVRLDVVRLKKTSLSLPPV